MTFTLEIDGRTRQVELAPADPPGQWSILVDGQPVAADVHLVRPGVLSLLIAGQSYRIVLDADNSDPALHVGPQRVPYRIDDPRSLRSRRRHASTDGPIVLRASMPGRVVRILAEKGDPVAAHQGILVVEAMKMQNEIKSPKDGHLRELRVSPGDTVSAGDTLAIIE